MVQNIFFFVPNIIGYARIILLLVAFYLMKENYMVSSFLYITNTILDEFDGIAARRYNQATNFGALLDMVTDRVATTCLIMSLCYFYPMWIFLWQLLVALDISSHWIQMYSCVLLGENSHKVTGKSQNPILLFYYHPIVLTVFCIGSELFFCSLYLMAFTPGVFVNLFGHHVGLVSIIALLTSPICILKQLISVIQLVTACRNLGHFDGIQHAQVTNKTL